MELKRCPVCGGAALVIHMFDTYDRADYGEVAMKFVRIKMNVTETITHRSFVLRKS